jgi:hypothetical protein
MSKTLRMAVLLFALLRCELAQAQGPDFTPQTPLLGAAIRNDTAEVRRLLNAGANPNEGQLVGMGPIFFAITHQNLEMLRMLVTSGANVGATDRIGSTTLMWATFTESGQPELVEELLKLGVDVTARNQNGETALTWALRRGNTPVVAVLRKAGASENNRIKASVEQAVGLLQKSSSASFKATGCASCHNQSLPLMAIAAARKHGFAVDEQVAAEQVKAVFSTYAPLQDVMRTQPDRIPDPAISVSYALMGMAAEQHAPDALTAAMSQLISKHQAADGHFRTLPMRPPIESSEFTSTALSVRALQIYGNQFDEKIDAAREWLQNSKPQTNEDAAMQLLGLVWTRADQRYVRKATAELIAQQRPDGGWAQLSTLETDAYATGQALVALMQSGQVKMSDSVYSRGIDYLLRTQLRDGSWLVRTRAFPFQPYRDLGFPHGKDQFISAAGTSWAVMALSQTEPERAESYARSEF